MRLVVIAGLTLLGAFAGCRCNETPGAADASITSSDGGSRLTAEVLPRCRPEGSALPIAGEDVVVGESVAKADALLVGVVRRQADKRTATVLRTAPDLASPAYVDLGPARGDEPPPFPFVGGGAERVAYYGRSGDAGTGGRTLFVARLENKNAVVETTVPQESDDSFALSIAWPDGGARENAMLAWDEDAPLLAQQLVADRGVIKIRSLADNAKARVVSPDTSDADSPRLLLRKGGFWLAWLARKIDRTDAGPALEGAGEWRAYHWVEIVALDAHGEVASPVRRVSPETGHASAFELSQGEGKDASQVTVFVQDEAARGEGSGSRFVRYTVSADRVDGTELVDGGIGEAIVALLSVPDASAPRWLAWTDLRERAHLAPFGPLVTLSAPPSLEPSFDRTRLLAASTTDTIYAVTSARAKGGQPGPAEIRRFSCAELVTPHR